MSFQNRPAKKSNQITGNDFRAMLKGQGLLLEFWDEAITARAYVQNRIMNRLIADNKIFSLYRAFYGQVLAISYFRKFRC